MAEEHNPYTEPGAVDARPVDGPEDVVVDGISRPTTRGSSERADRVGEAIVAIRKKEPGLELWHLELSLGDESIDVLFAPPTEPQFQECTGKSAENKAKAPHFLRQLAMQVTRYPDPDVFRETIRRRPGVALKVANEAIAVASLEAPDLARKV